MVEFAPRTASFINGMGLGLDSKMSQEFVRLAEAAGITPVVPEMVDITDSGRVAVIPSLAELTRRVKPALECDLVIVTSAGIIAAGCAVDLVEIRDNQAFAVLNGSVRSPETTFAKFRKKPFNESCRDLMLTSFDIQDMDELAVAKGYEPAMLVMPGPTKRHVAASEGYETAASAANHPLLLAKLLNTFALHGLAAGVKKVRHDVRLDDEADVPTGKTHEELLGDMRDYLAEGIEIGVEIIEKGSHFFGGDEAKVIRDLLSGDFFAKHMTEIWSRRGVRKLVPAPA